MFFHPTQLKSALLTAAALLLNNLLPAQPAGPAVPGCTVRYVHRYSVYPSSTAFGVPTPTDSTDREVVLHRLQGRLRYREAAKKTGDDSSKCDYRPEGWVADLKGRQVLHLFTFQGKKMLRRSNLSRDPKAVAAERKNLVYTRETRTILGYPCRKVLYQAGEKAELWVTNAIPLGVSPVYFHLAEGVVLEAKTGRSRYLATEIFLHKPEPALFDYGGRQETNRTVEQKIVNACY